MSTKCWACNYAGAMSRLLLAPSLMLTNSRRTTCRCLRVAAISCSSSMRHGCCAPRTYISQPMVTVGGLVTPLLSTLASAGALPPAHGIFGFFFIKAERICKPKARPMRNACRYRHLLEVQCGKSLERCLEAGCHLVSCWNSWTILVDGE